MTPRGQEARVLDAAKWCCERWGHSKVTIDDIATAGGVSRATLYRLFPGGKDVLFDALRVRELTDFFDRLTAAVDGVDDFEELVVRLVVTATRELRADEHLAMMLGSEPGEALRELTVEGLPRTIAVATEYLAPLVRPYLTDREAGMVIDLLVRMTLSYFFAPSEVVDLGDPQSARHFIQPGLRALALART